MNLTLFSLALVILMSAFSCSKPAPADLVLQNGRVFTVDPNNPLAEAVAVTGNRITAVGSDSEIGKFIAPGATRVIDLGGKFVVPGFSDAHVHFLSMGSALEKIDLVGITSYGQIRERVAARAKGLEPGAWITGRGWDQTLVPGGAWPTKEVIDPVTPDNPVSLTRVDGHSVLVNSYVLKESGINRDTPDPDGGEIVRDPDTGEPTGVLKENAMSLVKRPGRDGDQGEEGERHLRLALEVAKTLGVTSIHHIGGGLEFFEQAAGSGELTVRVYYCPKLTADPGTLKQYSELKQKYSDNPLIRFGFLKSFIDGTLGSATAALFEPFNDNPSTSGVLVIEPEELEKMVLEADRLGFQIGIHAIGTRGNHLVLDAYEKAVQASGRRDSRHRIEHTQILIEEDLPRLARLGVIASMQPSHCITDKRYAEARLGKKRCRYAYAWRSVLNAGAHVAFGTDAPVEILNPMDGLYAAVTRKDRAGEAGEGWIPEEKLTMEEAIELYTLGSAYASFEEELKGSIQPGKLADMAVLSQNLLEISEDKIQETEVVYTIFDGKIIYEK